MSYKDYCEGLAELKEVKQQFFSYIMGGSAPQRSKRIVVKQFERIVTSLEYLDQSMLEFAAKGMSEKYQVEEDYKFACHHVRRFEFLLGIESKLKGCRCVNTHDDYTYLPPETG